MDATELATIVGELSTQIDLLGEMLRSDRSAAAPGRRLALALAAKLCLELAGKCRGATLPI